MTSVTQAFLLGFHTTGSELSEKFLSSRPAAVLGSGHQKHCHLAAQLVYSLQFWSLALSSPPSWYRFGLACYSNKAPFHLNICGANNHLPRWSTSRFQELPGCIHICLCCLATHFHVMEICMSLKMQESLMTCSKCVFSSTLPAFCCKSWNWLLAFFLISIRLSGTHHWFNP